MKAEEHKKEEKITFLELKTELKALKYEFEKLKEKIKWWQFWKWTYKKDSMWLFMKARIARLEEKKN